MVPVAKLQRERAENVAIAALLVQLLVALIAFWVAKYVALTEASHPDLFLRWKWAPAVLSAAWFLFIGVGFWLMAWLHLRQLRLAELEDIEWKRLVAERAAGGARGRLFEEDEIAGHVARNRLRMLEKYVLPLASLVLLIVLGLVGWWLFPSLRGAGQELGVLVDRCPFSAAAVAACCFVSFLMGMYASGMSRQREWRPLRAGAGYMMASALFCALVALGLAVGSFAKEYLWVIRIVAYVIPAAMMLVSVEIFLNFILDFYRPRIEGVEYRPSYDSRLLGMFAEPGGVFRTVASTLDYQFGFEVSETWFYRFLERAIAPLLIFMLLSFYLLTCFVIVGPGEEAIVERFGKAVTVNNNKVLGPGFYVKWPWPICRVYRLDTKTVRRIDIGFDEMVEKEAKKDAAEQPKKVLWTVKHYEKEYQVMVAEPEILTDVAESEKGIQSEGAVPVGLISAVMNVFYRITRFGDYLYQKVEPERVLKVLAYREQQKYFAGVDFFDIMSSGRMKAGEDLRAAIQEAADKEKLGVEILKVALCGIHPPVEEELGQAFQAVVGAEQEKQADIHAGESYANERGVATRYDASIQRAKAHAYRAEQREKAKAEVARQLGQWQTYRAAPGVYKMGLYLDGLLRSFEEGKARKLLVTSKDIDLEVLQLNVEDSVRIGPEDITLEEQ